MTKQEWKTNLRALVVGGAGFVGSHLCRRLLQSGYEEVICVDNLQTGRIANVADLLGSPHFSFFEHDIVNEWPVSGALHEIYHLACPASPVQYQKSPIHTFKTSVLGSIHLLELAKDKMTMVIVTHEIDFARHVSDRVVFIDGGVIVEEGKPEDVIDHPSNERTQNFLKKLQRG